MTKKGIIGVTAIVVLALVAFKNDPTTGQTVITNLFDWILP